jgi:hypothetical protein
MRTLRDATLVTAGVVAAAAAVAVAIPRSVYPRPADVGAASATLSVTARTDDLAEGAALALEWSPERDVRLRGTSGTVTAVLVGNGDDIECGRPLIEVDGRNVLGYCAPAPLYRTIEPGTHGDDVDQLVEFLTATGYLSETDPDPGQLARAIDALGVEVGLEANGRVDPADMIWVGESARVGSMELQVGDLVAGQESVFRIHPQLLAARSLTPPPSEAAWLFGLDGSPARFHLDRGGAVVELDALAEQLLAVVTGEALPSTVAGSIRLQTPVEVIGVPASAIVATSADLCVIAVDADVTRAVPVDVIGSSVGVAFVAAALRPGQTIQSQPAADQAC